MSKDNDPKPSGKPRQRQARTAASPSTDQGFGEILNGISELTALVKAIDLNAVNGRIESIEQRLAASEKREIELLSRAETAEKRAATAEKHHQTVLDHLRKIEHAGADLSAKVIELSNGQAAGQQLVLEGLTTTREAIVRSVEAVAEAHLQVVDSIKTVATQGAKQGEQLQLFRTDTEGRIQSITEQLGLVATTSDLEAIGAAHRSEIRGALRLAGTRVEAAVKIIHERNVGVTTKALENTGKYIDKAVEKIVGGIAEPCADIRSSSEEIKEAKSLLATGANALVKAQSHLLDVGPFVEAQIMSSFNHVVVSATPEITRMFAKLLDGIDLKALPALANQFELMLEESSSSVQTIREAGEIILSSNNNVAAANRELGHSLAVSNQIIDSFAARLDAGEVEQLTVRIERSVKSAITELDGYKGSIEGLFSHLTNVMVNTLGGELEGFISRLSISNEQLEGISESVSARVLASLLDDYRANM